MTQNRPKTGKELLAFLKETEDGRRKLKAVKNNIESNNAEGFKDIFSIISKTTLKTLLGREFYAFDKQIEDPGRFSLRDLDFMADLFEIDRDKFIAFVRKSIKNTPTAKKGK